MITQIEREVIDNLKVLIKDSRGTMQEYYKDAFNAMIEAEKIRKVIKKENVCQKK